MIFNSFKFTNTSNALQSTWPGLPRCGWRRTREGIPRSYGGPRPQRRVAFRQRISNLVLVASPRRVRKERGCGGDDQIIDHVNIDFDSGSWSCRSFDSARFSLSVIYAFPFFTHFRRRRKQEEEEEMSKELLQTPSQTLSAWLIRAISLVIGPVTVYGSVVCVFAKHISYVITPTSPRYLPP